ncbi:winged helix-turn-helix domain-containing protein [Streptomyces sp. NPDC048504]|uniref:helix-turn-helix domain-containing protein n=1 Tax=Streptomyces sp. NPDC048504 TaxID=3365559 RepID=UPI00371C6156
MLSPPAEGAQGLTAGLATPADTPADRVHQDVADALRRYYEVAAAPCRERTPARVEADRSIRGRPLPAGELTRLTRVSAPTVSRHITALRDARLISSLRFGTSVLHTLTPLGAAPLRGADKPVSSVP